MSALIALAIPVSGRSPVSAIADAASARPMLLAGSLVPGLAKAHRLRAVSAQRQLNVTVTLRVRDEAGLNTLLSDLYNPASPEYHRFLTVKQFVARFAPDTSAVSTTAGWLRSKGLHVVKTSGNRLQLTARGTAAKLETAFNSPLAVYQHGSRTFVANSRLIQLPGAIAGNVLSVSGLSTATQQQPSLVAHQSVADSGGYTPPDIRALYNVSPLLSAGINGTGQTIGIVSFADYDESDIATFDSRFNITNHVSRVTVSGGGSAGLGARSGQDEAEADIELAQSIAPEASVLVYEAANSSEGAAALYNQIVSDNRASVISTSWGGAEDSYSDSDIQAVHQAVQEGAAQGQTFFAASGDNGAYDDASDPHGDPNTLSVDYPASDPLVTGVGGTALDSNGGQYGGESVWSDDSDPRNPTGSGGGLSSLFSRPSYQQGPGVNNTYSNGKRQVPDVAADADPNTGFAIYTINGSSRGGSSSDWTVAGGTSAAAPLWTSFAALVTQATGNRLGSFNPTLYALGASASGFAQPPFHDVTEGTNLHYPATPGWDFATGWGSFNGAAFIADLSGVPLPTATPKPTATSTPIPTSTPTPTPTAVKKPTAAPSISIKQVVLLHAVKGKKVSTSTLKIGEAGTLIIVYGTQHAGSLQTSGTLVIKQKGVTVATVTLKRTTYAGKPALTATIKFTSSKRVGTLQATIKVKVGSTSKALTQPIKLVTK